MNLVRYTLTVFFFMSFLQSSLAQLIENGDTLYGNEWINYDQTTLKIKVAEDGLYRLTYDVLLAAGIPIEQIPASAYRLYWMGKEQKIHSSTTNPLSPGDYLEFYGRRNRSGLDRYLFQDPDQEMLNPEYSFHTDTSSYFLTWDGQAGVRYEEIVNDLNGALPPLRSWYQHTETLVLADGHFKPFLNSQVRFSHYVEAEGFGSSESTSHDFSLPASAALPAQSTSTIHYRLTGNSQFHEVSISWNGQPLSSHTFPGANGRGGAPLIDTVIPVSGLQETNTLSAQSGGGNDKIRFGTIALTYPRELRFDGQPAFGLTLDDIRDGATLEFLGLNTSTRYRVFDLSAGYLTEIIFEGDVGRLNLPPGPNRRELHVVSDVGVKTVSVAKKTQWERLDRSDAEFIIISNPKLYDDGQGTNWVQEYANYRQSNPGGSYRTKIIDIDQVIDQFAYGVDMHPLGIKNFSNYLAKYWTDPQFIFLVGKGLEYAEARRHEEPYEYLPVYGLPGSDNLLTSRALSSVPLVPVGRIAARSPDQIGIYLDKIKVMEDQIANAPQTIEARGWMKRVLHLSAGSGASEQSVIAGKMDQMARVIEDNEFGAQVTTIRKQSQDVFDQSRADIALGLINDGIMLKTYFGHGSLFFTQFLGFEDPVFLNNRDRYPFMCALGCHTGNIFEIQKSLGEVNVTTAEKGGIAYFATSGLGFLFALDVFAKDLYALFGDQYGAPIGQSIQKSISIHNTNESIGIKTLLQQITLHGDPAFRFHAVNAPDILVDPQSVRTTPDVISLQSDSFNLSFDILNIGKNVSQEIEVEFRQVLPSGEESLISIKKVHVDGYQTDVSVNLPVINGNLLGQNRIKITLDIDNSIIELPDPSAELNNTFINTNGQEGFEVFFFDADIRPVYPRDFAIINDAKVELVATTSNALAPKNKYTIQIDTTELYDSPVFEQIIIDQPGGVIKWQPSLTFLPEKVYYWRIRPDSAILSADVIPWMQNSFVFLPDEKTPGWNQSHYYQFLNNEFQKSFLDSTSRALSFERQNFSVIIRNKVNEAEDPPTYNLDGNTFKSQFDFRVDPTINVTVLDPNGKRFKRTNELTYGSDNRTNGTLGSFFFRINNTEERSQLVDFLTNIIPSKSFVFLYTSQATVSSDFDLANWDNDPESIYQVLEDQGATHINMLKAKGSVPYALAFVKDDRILDEAIANDVTGIAKIDATFGELLPDGAMSSTIVGPVSSWQSLAFDLSDIDANDSISVSIFGFKQPESPPVLIRESVSSVTDLSAIDAENFPFLRLKYSYKDQLNGSIPNLNYWRVLFQGLPEVTFDIGNTEVIAKQITPGQELPFQARILNLSNYNMDSLLAKFTWINQTNQVETKYERFEPIPARSELTIATTLSIENPTDKNQLIVELNPDSDQQELYHFNNFLRTELNLLRDKAGPILDVTFDGRRIMDGDLVAAKPLVEIKINDENEEELITDSSSVTLKLLDPSGTIHPIDPSSDEIFFTPATNHENIASIEWSPEFTQDGLYTLIAQGQDKSGNKSASSDYQIQFEVITARMISNIIPYPNPFVSQVKFAYTLTGDVPPSSFKLSIYTVSGTVVRELTQADLGPLQIGTQVTDLSWDGTDGFGDRLANGTYLYKFEITDPDFTEISDYNTGTDIFFESDYGKIVLLR